MIKKLLSYVKEYKKESLLTPLSMIIEVAMEMVVPILMASLVNDGIRGNDGAGDMAHIIKMGILMIVAALIGLGGGIMGGVFGAKASAGFAKNLRKGMFDRIQTFSFKNIDKFSTAGLVTRLTTDVANVQNSYQMILRMGMRIPMTFGIAMVMSFAIKPKLALIYLIAVIILGGILAFIISKAMKAFEQAFPKYDELNASVQENVSAIRVVKAYVREDHEKKKFKTASNNIYKIFSAAEKLTTFNGPAMSITVYACTMLISWFGANMIINTGATELNLGDLTALLQYCMRILISLMLLSMIFIMLTMSAASARRISEVLDEEPDITNPENPVMEVKDGSIIFKDVNFRYNKDGKENVLSNINIKIDSGETIGIIGGTGSAKSTLVNLISRLYDVNDGSILVGGRDVRDYDLEVLRDEVSVVLQKNVLFSGTIMDNLRWGVRKKKGSENLPETPQEKAEIEAECIRACKLACADEFIEKMPDKYETYIEQGGTNVSGGQKQRLCIARALVKKPKILILDDSTSAVDTATDAKIRKAFAEEIPGTTKLIIAQRISSVMNADRIIVMEDGKINGFGTHEELLKNNTIYRDVYESQTGGNGDFDEGGER
ncbi:MAG: ABC transporter ATP-binding protein/permease [Lachnospiraceae bacterium]|nr:ABC transporter ATP-binding protein/permease [Lachnospiraceae bacterium]